MEVVGFPQSSIIGGANPIAQCEAAMVLSALWDLRSRCKDRQVVWFLDNTSALHSFIKGGSSNEALDRTVQAFHFLSHACRCNVWLEFVPSNSNWSDGISRTGFADGFANEHGFVLSWTTVAIEWWKMSLGELWSTFETAVDRQRWGTAE